VKQKPLHLFCLIVFLIGGNARDAFSFVLSNNSSEDPIQIDSDQGIVCSQEGNKCTAYGNVVAEQGDFVLKADTLTAFIEKEGDKSKLSRIEATGHVYCFSKTELRRAFADFASYDLAQGELTLEGGALKVQFKELEITAKKSLKYNDKTKILSAVGDAVAKEKDRVLMADELIGYLKEGPDQKLEVDKIKAFNNVKVSTPEELAQGREGTYDRTKQRATLKGNVRIDRKEGQLKGEFAEINLEKGVGKITHSHGRVRALLLAKSKRND
jgi:lipopolysaccharide export system protein LptA